MAQLNEAVLASHHKDAWRQQEVDGAALEELGKLINNGLRQLYEGTAA
jgi:hypothetical protein